MGSFSRGYGHQFSVGDYFPRAIKTICIICISVFFVQEMSELIKGPVGWNFWVLWFGLSPDGLVQGYVWQPLTYLFFHGGVLHILFNLLYLAMFGADLERSWGARKFYRYFLVCGVGAGLIDVLVRELLVRGHAINPKILGDPTIGASGAIYGVLLAVAMVMPHRRVSFLLLPISMPMWFFVAALGALEFFMTIGSSGDGISHVCHLGGMLVGYLYLRRGSYLYSPRNFFSDWKRRRLRKKFEVYARDHRDKPPSQPNDWLN